MCDAMPACWKHLSIEQRHEVVSIIGSIYKEAPADEPVWTKSNVMRLSQFVPLEDIFKLRACFFAAQRDPSALVGGDDDVVETQQLQSKTATADDFFSWKPDVLVDQHKQDKTNKKSQQQLFNHVTNFVAKLHWDKCTNLIPSAYLDVEMSLQQEELLNPMCKNALMGQILYDVKGKGAVQKIAKRRLDMIEGNISSYSRCLNDPKHLKAIKDLNHLVAAVAEVSADKETTKAKRKEDAANKEKEKEDKKKKEAEEEAAKKAELLPELKTIVAECEQGGDVSGLSTLTKPTLCNLVRCYFDAKPKGLSGMNKDDLVAEVSQRIVVTATELAATELGNEMVVDDNNEMDITP